MKKTIYILAIALFSSCVSSLNRNDVEEFVITHQAEKIGQENAIDKFKEDIGDSLKLYNLSNQWVGRPEWVTDHSKIEGKWFYEDSITTKIMDVEVYGNEASVFGVSKGYISGIKTWEGNFHCIVGTQKGKMVFKRYSWINSNTVKSSNSFVWPSSEVEGALGFYNKMRYAMMNLRNNDAAAYSDSLVKLDPNLAVAHLGQMHYLYINGEDDKLDQLLSDISPKMENASLAEINTINIYTRSNSRDEILSKIEQALIYAANDPQLRTWYAYYLIDRDKKVENLKIGLQRFPESSGLNNMMAYVLMAKEEYEAAENHLNVYMRVHPDEPNVYDSMGDLMLAKGDSTKAREMYLKAYKVSRELETGPEAFFDIAKEKADKLN